MPSQSHIGWIREDVVNIERKREDEPKSVPVSAFVA